MYFALSQQLTSKKQHLHLKPFIAFPFKAVLQYSSKSACYCKNVKLLGYSKTLDYALRESKKKVLRAA